MTILSSMNMHFLLHHTKHDGGSRLRPLAACALPIIRGNFSNFLAISTVGSRRYYCGK